jgi:hypothetical protein
VDGHVRRRLTATTALKSKEWGSGPNSDCRGSVRFLRFLDDSRPSQNHPKVAIKPAQNRAQSASAFRLCLMMNERLETCRKRPSAPICRTSTKNGSPPPKKPLSYIGRIWLMLVNEQSQPHPRRAHSMYRRARAHARRKAAPPDHRLPSMLHFTPPIGVNFINFAILLRGRMPMRGKLGRGACRIPKPLCPAPPLALTRTP